MKLFRIITVVGAGLLLLTWFGNEPAMAQEYMIQSGDQLSITFWQEPNLNTSGKVGRDGRIELPIVGRIPAAGLTTLRLSEDIVDKISRYRINITQASVAVTEYQGNKIFLTGQVGSPGTYSFEVIPNLWRVLQEAGGLTEEADIENITIIRAGEKSGDITRVSLAPYFEKGQLAKLPMVNGGDTIHVPSIPAVRSSPDALASPFASNREVYVAGAVVNPGRYNLEKNIGLMDAIILAGGLTPAADASAVKVLTDWGTGEGMIRVDLEAYLESSEPGPPPLLPGDTIYVPRKERSGAGTFILTRLLVPVITATTVAIAVAALR